MNKYLIVLLLASGLTACNKKESEKTAESPQETQKAIPAFEEEMADVKVKDLPLKTKEDTISYALGVAWSNGIAKIGLYKVSYAFYLGAHDFMVNNPTFTNAQQAGERLDQEIPALKGDSLPPMDPDQMLKEIKLSSKYDTLSYQLAYSWTRGARQYGIEKITPTLLLGLTKGIQGDTSLFDYNKADKYLRGQVERKRENMFADIKIKNEQWLVQNKNKEGVVSLPSGVQYKILSKGNGKSPSGMDVVEAHYVGRLIDNRKFESSYDNGQPLKFMPSGVIKGWREVLPLMKEGDKWELYIPYDLGYGSGGIKDKVPPFATLIYEFELLKVESNPI
ncbi:MAG TPA: FKBP-type peptidyl-prolyl cis-trans isomerase [Cytophagales bacterium]|nr:FKBP-type peptidyl-prolyl cis-trans isomerase [Cytophagales bacterium]